MTRISPIPNTSAEKAKNGTRRMVMPGARVVSTLVTRLTPTAVKPSAMSPWAARNSPTMSGLPPPKPPLLMSDTIERMNPPSHMYMPAATRRGKAMARAPSCSGTMATARPAASGSAVPNTRPTRWLPSSCAQESLSKAAAPPSTRSMAINRLAMMVATSPRRPAPMNIRPIFLWSVVVNQSTTKASGRSMVESPARSGLESMVVMWC